MLHSVNTTKSHRVSQLQRSEMQSMGFDIRRSTEQTHSRAVLECTCNQWNPVITVWPKKGGCSPEGKICQSKVGVSIPGSSNLHVKVFLGKILNPKLLQMPLVRICSCEWVLICVVKLFEWSEDYSSVTAVHLPFKNLRISKFVHQLPLFCKI